MPEPKTNLAYDLLAIDIDGTLADSKGRVSKENIEAVHRAREAGFAVLLCTGRNYAESAFAAEAVGAVHPMVTAGGSMVVEPGTGNTLHRFAMRTQIVQSVVDVLNRSGHAALVLKDRLASGFDYLVVRGDGGHELHPVTEWWLNHMQLTRRDVATLADDEHPEWTVRVGACGPSTFTMPLRDEIFELLQEQVTLHSFPAVTSQEHADGFDGQYHILEAFDSLTSKWAGIGWVCNELGIDPARTVAIGDQVNDLSMISGAGLGIAMANAIDEVHELADHATLDHNESGVAHAIDRVLSGDW
ncbi:MAG: HAD-IIB family hydrolase [Phycisphaerales bacterium JB061]